MYGEDSDVRGKAVASGVKGNSDLRGALRTLIHLCVGGEDIHRQGWMVSSLTPWQSAPLIQMYLRLLDFKFPAPTFLF